MGSENTEIHHWCKGRQGDQPNSENGELTMAIEYAISAGEGTLIDYGVAVEICYEELGAKIVKYDTGEEYWEYPCEEIPMCIAVTIIAQNCTYNCETDR
jgi:hypothetical protein